MRINWRNRERARQSGRSSPGARWASVFPSGNHVTGRSQCATREIERNAAVSFLVFHLPDRIKDAPAVSSNGYGLAEIRVSFNGLSQETVTGAKPRAVGASGGLSTAADEVWQLRDGWTAADTEPGAKIIPEGDAELPAGLGEPEEGVAAVATDVAAGSAADVALGHLAANVVFRTVGV